MSLSTRIICICIFGVAAILTAIGIRPIPKTTRYVIPQPQAGEIQQTDQAIRGMIQRHIRLKHPSSAKIQYRRWAWEESQQTVKVWYRVYGAGTFKSNVVEFDYSNSTLREIT